MEDVRVYYIGASATTSGVSMRIYTYHYIYYNFVEETWESIDHRMRRLGTV
jgi:hypothetical protein